MMAERQIITRRRQPMTANIIALRPSAARPRPRRKAAGFLGRLLAALAEADRIHRERHYLATMDDHLLRDIGVTRADVEAELRRPIGWGSLLFRG
jgi:uncharacterized protein YjiS (DUF1127 family)